MNLLAKSRIHPLTAGAAVAVIVACAVATAAVMGWVPGSKAEKPETTATATSANTQPPARVASAQTAARCASCGTVVAVKEVEVKGQASGGGALAGGAAGALLGHGLTQGNKNSNAVAVVGGVAGAVVGNEVEKRAKTHKRYDVAVRMEDGSTRTVSYAQAPTWRSGDRVRITEGKIQPRG